MELIEQFVRSKLPEFFVENHVKIVVREALWLSQFYTEADKEVIELGAWLHDIGHVTFEKYYDENGKPIEEEGHEVTGVRIARNYLKDTDKKDKILHCIESHRTSYPKEMRSIEAKIVNSADNLSHFYDFEGISKRHGRDSAIKKLKRDLKLNILPEAHAKEIKLAREIEEKYDIKLR